MTGEQNVDGIDDAMVEAAARTMFDGANGTSPGDYTWDDVVRDDETRAAIWRDDARAVLRAVAAVGRPVSQPTPAVDRDALILTVRDVSADHHGNGWLSLSGTEAARIADAVLAFLSQPTPTAEPRDKYLAGASGISDEPWGHAAAAPPSITDMVPGTKENPEGWPYSAEPANAKRCGVAYVGYEGGDGSCEYLPNHPGRHWSAQWGSWSL